MLLKIVVAIATAGRKDVLAETVQTLAHQSRLPNELIICPATDADIDRACLDSYPGSARIFFGRTGLTAQRNVLLDACEADVIIFFDDDFLPSDDYLKEVELLFALHPEIAIATGKVLADGIGGPGLSYLDGTQLLRDAGPNTESTMITATYNGYGCNMAIKMSIVRKNNVRFDERLPLYGWLEDLDFSRQLAKFGAVVNAPRLRGVHLGTKRSGRSPGKRLGYSQVANPIYLTRKGTMLWFRAFNQILKNFAANSVRSIYPEKWIDRRGRLLGNLKALRDLITGDLSPERAIQN